MQVEHACVRPVSLTTHDFLVALTNTGMIGWRCRRNMTWDEGKLSYDAMLGTWGGIATPALGCHTLATLSHVLLLLFRLASVDWKTTLFRYTQIFHSSGKLQKWRKNVKTAMLDISFGFFISFRQTWYEHLKAMQTFYSLVLGSVSFDDFLHVWRI